jgi:hypothetical protein
MRRFLDWIFPLSCVCVCSLLGSSAFLFVFFCSGGSADDRKDKQDMLDLKGQNAQLQKRLEKYRKREMELLRALKAQQLRRSSAGGGSGGGGSSGGSPLRQVSNSE